MHLTPNEAPPQLASHEVRYTITTSYHLRNLPEYDLCPGAASNKALPPLLSLPTASSPLDPPPVRPPTLPRPSTHTSHLQRGPCDLCAQYEELIAPSAELDTFFCTYSFL
jgi:hypothetical protein